VPSGARPRNVLLVLVDDQRYDALGFLGHPFLKTPALDRLAATGAFFRDAFVTTSLCCPSRATMLTGLYAHTHGVLDNRDDLDPAFPTWATLAQQSGADTAFFGKWHLGGNDPHPRPGFGKWVGFGGQGVYEDPDGSHPLSVDGERQPLGGYVTDVLTGHATAWLKDPARKQRPFAAVVSHKAVHAPFLPAERHRTAFADAPVPATLPDTDDAYADLPRWLRTLRHESEFDADHPYGRWPDFASWYRDYHRTLLSVDDSVGALLDALAVAGLDGDTAVIFTSDNGFLFGEQGVLDKRNFYEASIRVPLLVSIPDAGRQRPDAMALNVDLAPTVLELLGLVPPSHLHGRSLVAAASGRPTPKWRQEFVYEYFAEALFPHTPTMFGLRTAAGVKFSRAWGSDASATLHDLETDPQERTNLIADPAWQERAKGLRRRLDARLKRLGLVDAPVWGRNWLRGGVEAAAVPTPDEPEEQ
jgi:N-acetylglucosamine-6-sulfatase